MSDSASSQPPETPDSTRERLSRAGSLHWFHWLVVAASLTLTLFAWHFSKAQLERSAEAQFDREADRVRTLLLERMQKYEDALWAGVGAIQAQGGTIGHDSWRSFANTLSIDHKYPGINGIGVILEVPQADLASHLLAQRELRPHYRVHPEHSGHEHLPIVFIEPEASNRAAVGLDMAHEVNRYSATQKARDSGEARITGPIVLVQDAQKTPGFLLFVPYYRDDSALTPEQREDEFLGLVYAPFTVRRLMAGTLSSESRHVGIRITDADEVLYDEHLPTQPEFDPRPLFRRTVPVELYGRTWTFDIRSSSAFRRSTESSQPLTILLGGIAIDALLLALFLLLSRANRQAIAFADAANSDLVAQRERLKRSNEDLEQFAFAASHDLRAPLRGINKLVTWLQEDLDGQLTEENQKKLGLVRRRVNRLDRLLNDLLEYARIGKGEVALEETDSRRLALELLELQDADEVADGTVEGLPTFNTNRVGLAQVLSNLIGNALKHSGSVGPQIIISAEPQGEFYRFSVDDNGPGIPEDQRAKVFTMFRTIKSRDKVEGSGMGLALAKKQVILGGGELSLEDSPLGGCRVCFTWPKQWPSKSPLHSAN